GGGGRFCGTRRGRFCFCGSGRRWRARVGRGRRRHRSFLRRSTRYSRTAFLFSLCVLEAVVRDRGAALRAVARDSGRGLGVATGISQNHEGKKDDCQGSTDTLKLGRTAARASLHMTSNKLLRGIGPVLWPIQEERILPCAPFSNGNR